MCLYKITGITGIAHVLEALYVKSVLVQGAIFLRVMERTADFDTFDLSLSY